MSLITHRPQSWNAIVGQERAITLLQAVLTESRFLPRGFIFEGPKGCGKTTAARLTARALVCEKRKTEKLGCGVCPTCKVFELLDSNTDSIVNSYEEIKAAETGGVDAMRQLVENVEHYMGRRVIALDEAHRLSPQAWDVFLKPLELKVAAINSVYMFITTDSSAIPDTIRSRCVRIRFSKVPEGTVTGLLSSTCAEENIQYELSALQLIARRCEGSPRVALNALSQVAAMGTVTVTLVDAVMDNSLENTCNEVLWNVINQKQADAVKAMQPLIGQYSPIEIINTFWGMYAKAMFEPDNRFSRDIQKLGDVSDVTSLFVKWTTPSQVPADALPLFIYELIRHGQKHNTPTLNGQPTKRVITGTSFAEIAGLAPRGAVPEKVTNVTEKGTIPNLGTQKPNLGNKPKELTLDEVF